jgi:hypothetical protein
MVSNNEVYYGPSGLQQYLADLDEYRGVELVNSLLVITCAYADEVAGNLLLQPFRSNANLAGKNS